MNDSFDHFGRNSCPGIRHPFYISFCGGAFKLPASVSLLVPSVAGQPIIMLFFAIGFKVLFHETSGA